MRNTVFVLFMLVLLLHGPSRVNGEAGEGDQTGLRVPILLYHRLGPVAADGMTITTPVFEAHLKYLRDNGYKVIPLRQLVNYHLKKGPMPPLKAVVIVADDGHKSIYTDMLPLIKKYHVPVTLFLYPSAVSNASYAVSWDQLRELKRTGLFDFQGHTYWHPNFRKDKKRMSTDEYEKSIDMQLIKSKARLERELGVGIDMLAWPFGLYDDRLINKAREAGYIAAFSIEARHATAADNIMKLPRYLLINADRGRTFEKILQGKATGRNIAY